MNAVTESGAPLCYVAVDESRQLVYGANYHKGEVNVYRILDDGGLEATDAVFHQEATGPHKNQDHAHVHYTDLTPDNRLVVCDLGTDRVYTYDVSDQGKLTIVSEFVAEPGTGPRHLVFHPANETIAYLFGELDSTVRVLSYNKSQGSFEEKQKLVHYQMIFKEKMVVLQFVFQMMVDLYMLPIVAITQLQSLQFLKRINCWNVSKLFLLKAIS